MLNKALKTIIAAIFIVGTMFSLASCKDNTSNEQVIVFGISPDNPPYEYLNSSGEIVGIDVEIAQHIATKLNKNLVIKNIDFNGLIPALQAGHIDAAISSIGRTDERSNMIDFSIPYLSSQNALFYLKEPKNNPHNLNNQDRENDADETSKILTETSNPDNAINNNANELSKHQIKGRQFLSLVVKDHKFIKNNNSFDEDPDNKIMRVLSGSKVGVQSGTTWWLYLVQLHTKLKHHIEKSKQHLGAVSKALDNSSDNAQITTISNADEGYKVGEKSIHISSQGDLQNAQGDHVSEAALLEEFDIQSLPNNISLLQELKNGNIDYLLLEANQASHIINSGLEVDYVLLDKADDNDMAIGLKKGSDLKQDINRILQEMHQKGEIDKILEKYINLSK